VSKGLLTDAAIAGAVILGGVAIIGALEGSAGNALGGILNGITQKINDAIASGANAAGQAAGQAIPNAAAGLGKGAIDAGDSIWDKIKNNLVKFGSKDSRTPIDTNSDSFATYYANYIEPATGSATAVQPDGTPIFTQLPHITYSIDSQGNIDNQFGQLQSFNPYNI